MPDEEVVVETGAGDGGAQDPPQVEEVQDLEEGEIEEREPGGDSPEQIRARKEYRLRKKTEAALQVEREKVIALDARVNTLREVAEKVAKPPVKEEQRLTSAEAWGKVDSGEWTREAATEYIADSRFLLHSAKQKEEEQQDRAVREVVATVEKAKKEAFEYVALVPSLKTQSHPRWGEIVTEVNRLLSEGGVGTRFQAEREALRKILGPIEQIRERQKMETVRASGDSHTETRGAAGGAGAPPNKKDPFPDIPQFTKDLWDKTNTSQKDREIEAKYYREEKARRAR